MSSPADKFLFDSLQKREKQNSLRKLTISSGLVDFCSNDYLGFARSIELSNAIEKTSGEYSLSLNGSFLNGSGGSRLLAGNSEFVEELEKEIAAFHHAEAGLLYNSGYDANVGLFSSLGQKGDTIIYDELIHASVHDGIRLSKASAFPFKHNDPTHLEERLRSAENVVYVAVESIYSMDGDEADLKNIMALCEKYNASLIVDEAHATGITPNAGKGLVQELAMEEKVFARVHTFGKALGCHGAIVLGSSLLRNYQVNFSRSFIYTTALPVKSLIAIQQSYRLLQRSTDKIRILYNLIDKFKQLAGGTVPLIPSNSAIQSVVVSGNDQAKILAEKIRKAGFDVRPILSPTVPKGKERLRICLHVFNTEDEVQELIKAVQFFL